MRGQPVTPSYPLGWGKITNNSTLIYDKLPARNCEDLSIYPKICAPSFYNAVHVIGGIHNPVNQNHIDVSSGRK